MRPPIAEKRPGSRRKSTISFTSSFASSTPGDIREGHRRRLRVGLARLALERGIRPDVTRYIVNASTDETEPEHERAVAVGDCSGSVRTSIRTFCFARSGTNAALAVT
jgi:hypothetical protein